MHPFLVRYFNIIASILIVLLYATGKIPPSEKYNFWVLSFSIPFALTANIILLFVFLFLRKRSTIYYVVALLIGSPYVTGTIGLKYLFRKEPTAGFSFTAMNYNLGGYHMRPYVYTDIDSAKIALKNWLLYSDADIKCYQEFANFPWSKELNAIEQLNKNGSYYYFSQEEETDHVDYSRAGTLIISKFPIVSSGDVLASENGFNRIAYADVLIKKDTVRIINVHLESMGLTYLGHHARNIRSLKTIAMIIFSKLKNGVLVRSTQINQLAAFIDSTPYPVICMGDFNDLPYSYTYQLMKEKMKNSFEESGRGFGFTYKGGRLAGLRIDNQFYTSSIRSTGFETLDSIKFSDHFPIWGEYQLVDR